MSDSDSQAGDCADYYHTISSLPTPGHAQCAHCKKRERQLLPDIKLKRCAGCSVVTYCSKACQKAAWPYHRGSCGSAVHSQTETCAGYATPIALAQAVHNWADVHAHALETLSNATVLANGGISANLESPRILRLTLVPGAKTDGEKPADPFRLFEVSIEHKDDMRPFVSSWEYIEAECDRKTRFFKRLPDVVVLGSIPAVFVVPGTPIATYHYYPVYGLRNRHMGALPEYPRAVCEDVMTMCLEAVNRGLVRRPSPCARCEEQNSPSGEAPRGVREHKERKWELMDDWEWVLTGDFKPRCGLDPMKVWALYSVI